MFPYSTSLRPYSSLDTLTHPKQPRPKRKSNQPQRSWPKENNRSHGRCLGALDTRRLWLRPPNFPCLVWLKSNTRGTTSPSKPYHSGSLCLHPCQFLLLENSKKLPLQYPCLAHIPWSQMEYEWTWNGGLTQSNQKNHPWFLKTKEKDPLHSNFHPCHPYSTRPQQSLRICSLRMPYHHCKGDCGAELNWILAGGPKLIYYNNEFTRYDLPSRRS